MYIYIQTASLGKCLLKFITKKLLTQSELQVLLPPERFYLFDIMTFETLLRLDNMCMFVHLCMAF